MALDQTVTCLSIGNVFGIGIHLLLPLESDHVEKIVDRSARQEAINSLAAFLTARNLLIKSAAYLVNFSRN